MALLLNKKLRPNDPVAKVPSSFYNDVDQILSRLDVFGGHVERNGNNWLIVVDGAGTPLAANYKQSVEVDTSDNTVHLVNDSATPGASKAYSTDTAGAKGWHDIPTGLPAVPVTAAYLGWDTASGVHWVTLANSYMVATKDTDGTLKGDYIQAH